MTSPSTDSGARRGWQAHARAWFSYVVVGAAIVYIFWLIQRNIAALAAGFQTLGYLGIAAFLILATVSIAISALYHGTLLSLLVPSPLSVLRASTAYAVGQIVRYLPGKVWGLVYEADSLKGQADIRQIALSVVIQTLLGYAWALTLSSTMILAAYAANPAWYLLFIPALVLLWCAHRIRWSLGFLSSLPIIGRRLGSSGIEVSLDSASALRLTALLTTNWLPFISGWVLLLATTHSPGAAVNYAAAYILASVLTTALVIVPSGLVVREALFAWIGTAIGLPVAELLLYGVLVRILLTLADLLNATVFVFARRLNPVRIEDSW